MKREKDQVSLCFKNLQFFCAFQSSEFPLQMYNTKKSLNSVIFKHYFLHTEHKSPTYGALKFHLTNQDICQWYL